MANNTISQVEINGTTYDLLDANTLSAVSALYQRVTSLEFSVSVLNITNTVTKASNYVAAYKVYKIGKIVIVKCTVGAGIPDKTDCLTNLPDTLNPIAGCAFFMNNVDAKKGMCCSVFSDGSHAKLQYRCGELTTGSDGVILTAIYPVDE